MPAQVSLVAKNAALANVTFDALSPSAGDGSAAIYQALSLGTTPAARPRLEIMSRRNAGKDGRKVFLNLFVPCSSVVNGITVTSILPVRCEATVADAITDAQLADTWSYFSSLAATTQVAAVINSRYAPS